MGYFNVYSAPVSAAPAATSFVTTVNMLNFNAAFFHVKYQSFATFVGSFSVWGSGNDGADYCALPSMSNTISGASGCIGFNIVDFEGTHLRLQYAANGATSSGTIAVAVTAKSNK